MYLSIFQAAISQGKQVSDSIDDRALCSPLVVIESIAQVAVILASKSMAAERREGDRFFFAGIQNARIGGAVFVGDDIKLEARLERIRRGIGWFHGSATVRGRRIVDVMMQAVFRPSAEKRYSFRVNVNEPGLSYPGAKARPNDCR